MRELPQETLTVKELQQILKIGVNSAYTLIHSKAFPVIKIGQTCRIPMAGESWRCGSLGQIFNDSIQEFIGGLVLWQRNVLMVRAATTSALTVPECTRSPWAVGRTAP